METEACLFVHFNVMNSYSQRRMSGLQNIVLAKNINLVNADVSKIEFAF